MAFFENLTKKAGELAQAATTKSKEIAEVTKLNLSVSSEEDKIRRMYNQIGEIYYKNGGKDVNGEMSALVSQIDGSNAKIAELRQKIVDVKAAGMEAKAASMEAKAAHYEAMARPKPEETAPAETAASAAAEELEVKLEVAENAISEGAAGTGE